MMNFETKTALMPHQVDAVNKLLPSRVSALFADMGTGKTRMILDLVYRRQKKIDKLVYFCPVSLKDTVRQEIAKHTTLDASNIYTFDDKTRDGKLPDKQVYIIGIESMSSSVRAILSANKLITPNTYAVVDESSYIKGHRALRAQRITKMCEITRYRSILTGTPISQGIVDLYAQMRFLSPKILGYNSFYSFAANHLEYSDKYPGRIVRSHNTEYIAAKIKPYVYQITKDECLDLPEKLYSHRYLHMSEEQDYWYNKIKDETFEQMDKYGDDDYGRYITSHFIFELFTKLQQITSGFVKYHGSIKELDNSRVRSLVNVVQSIPEQEKVLIFCKFQYDVDSIKKALSENFGESSTTWFDGRVSEKGRKKAVDTFAKSTRFLVVTQSTGGHGFNFQDLASYAIFYNNGFKYSERIQAEDRLHRIGQTKRPTYIDLYCISGIEERIEKALCSKANVVEEFRKEVDKVKKDKLKELITKL